MKKTTKALALVLCAMLLVVGSVMGTLAYLTDEEAVSNTFTVGNIEIKLDEAKVDENGKKITPEERHADGNDYHLLPNLTYDKDPTVWVKEGSEEAYIRMIVTVENYDNMLLAFSDEDANYDDGYIVDDSSSVLGSESSGTMVVLDELVNRDSAAWKCVKFTQDESAKTGTYEFRYNSGAYTATEDNEDATIDYDKLAALFTTITVPKEIDNEHLGYLNDTTITVTAQAIQAEGFIAKDGKTAEDMAWEAFPAN